MGAPPRSGKRVTSCTVNRVFPHKAFAGFVANILADLSNGAPLFLVGTGQLFNPSNIFERQKTSYLTRLEQGTFVGKNPDNQNSINGQPTNFRNRNVSVGMTVKKP